MTAWRYEILQCSGLSSAHGYANYFWSEWMLIVRIMSQCVVADNYLLFFYFLGGTVGLGRVPHILQLLRRRARARSGRLHLGLLVLDSLPRNVDERLRLLLPHQGVVLVYQPLQLLCTSVTRVSTQPPPPPPSRLVDPFSIPSENSILSRVRHTCGISAFETCQTDEKGGLILHKGDWGLFLGRTTRAHRRSRCVRSCISVAVCRSSWAS